MDCLDAHEHCEVATGEAAHAKKRREVAAPAPAAPAASKAPAARAREAYAREFLRAENEDDDGYDPYSDRRPAPEPLFERDPWS
jgi:hypothetical protein